MGFFALKYGKLWIQAYMSVADVRFPNLIRMHFTKINPNVIVQEEAVHSGSAAVKLFGQFVAGENYSGVSQGISVAAGQRVEAEIQSYIRSQDSIAGSDNTVVMKVEFYRTFGGKHGSLRRPPRSRRWSATGADSRRPAPGC